MKGIFTLFATLVLAPLTALVADEKLLPKTLEIPRAEIIAQMMKDFGLTREQVEQEPWRKILDHDNWYHRIAIAKMTGVVASGDLDGDGRPEIIAAKTGGGLAIITLPRR